MRVYLQRYGRHRKRSSSSRFDEESCPRTERKAHTTGVGPSGIILGNFVNTVPSNIV